MSDEPIKRIFCLSGRRKNPRLFPHVPRTGVGQPPSVTPELYNYFIRSTAGNLLICRTSYIDYSDPNNLINSPEKTYTASCNISGFCIPIPGTGFGAYQNTGWYWGYPYWDSTSSPYRGIDAWNYDHVVDIQWKTSFHEYWAFRLDQAGLGTMTNIKVYPFCLIRVNPDERVSDEKWWFWWEGLYFIKTDGDDSPVGTYNLHTGYDGCHCAVGNGSTYYDNRYFKAYEDDPSPDPSHKLQFPPTWLTGVYPNYSATNTVPVITIVEKYA